MGKAERVHTPAHQHIQRNCPIHRLMPLKLHLHPLPSLLNFLIICYFCEKYQTIGVGTHHQEMESIRPVFVLGQELKQWLTDDG